MRGQSVGAKLRSSRNLVQTAYEGRPRHVRKKVETPPTRPAAL